MNFKDVKEEKSANSSPNQEYVSSEDFHKFQHEISERVEARTNRQLRKTMIGRNMPEAAEGKTWADTKRWFQQRSR